MLTSLIGTLVIGAALAWTGTTSSSPQSATAGSVSASVYNYVPTANVVIPTALPIKVGDAGITNSGAIAVNVTGGSVSGIVTGDGACNAYIGISGITGSVTVTNAGFVGPSTSFSPLYDVFLTMGTGAPNGCQGQTISFNLTVNVAT